MPAWVPCRAVLEGAGAAGFVLMGQGRELAADPAPSARVGWAVALAAAILQPVCFSQLDADS